MALLQPSSASELAVHLEQEGRVHLHRGNPGWVLVGRGGSNCGGPRCFVLRLKRQGNGQRIMEEETDETAN